MPRWSVHRCHTTVRRIPVAIRRSARLVRGRGGSCSHTPRVDPRRGEALRPGDAGPTLAGIARQAGVSVSTVSKVLNGGTDVAPATREAVQRLLTEMGYQRPRASRRVSRGNLVDLLINEIDSAWAMALIGGVEEVVDDAGFSLVLTAARHRAPVVNRWFESLLDRGSLGAVVMHSDLTDEQQAELLRRGMPFVLCDPPVELSRVPEQIPAVGVANTEGARMATAHLIELGRTRIAAIGGPQRVASARARLAGYRQALADAGIPFDPALVRSGKFQSETGIAAVEELLRLSELPTAILAGNDQQATGALATLRRYQVAVPEQVSVVGFDDQDFCSWTNPGLTTVRQPLGEMGVTAARMLLDLVAGRRLSEMRVELP